MSLLSKATESALTDAGVTISIGASSSLTSFALLWEQAAKQKRNRHDITKDIRSDLIFDFIV
jgi:hypothetical protein